jgi:hypothetical protein
LATDGKLPTAPQWIFQHREILWKRLASWTYLIGMRTIAAFILSASAVCAATLGQQTVTLADNATPLACGGQRYVNKLTIRVIPGFVGKVFVGTPRMDPNYYSNTIAILFPNLGAHSEEYVVQDPSGDDGIDLCAIAVAGEVPGENAIAEYVSNNGGTVAPANLLVPTVAVVQAADDTPAPMNRFTLIRVQSIPGFELQTELEAASAETDIFLAPNMGDITQHNAWSEKWERADPLGANGLTAALALSSLAGSGEAVLLSGWQKQAADGTMVTPVTTLTWVASPMGIGDAAAAIPSAPGVVSVRVHKVPGTLFDSKDEIDDAQGNPLGLLFPNTSSAGWSESIDFGNGTTGPLTVLTNSGNVDQVAYDVLSVSGTLPPVLGSVSSQVGGYVTGGVAIGRGYVKRLRVQVVPGGAGLVFLGTATMNTATLDGVYAILYPNAVGRWSETFEIDDPEGDGISTDDLYVQTEVPGEAVIVSTITTGVTPPDGVLTVKMAGALSGSFGSFAVPFATASTPVALVRAQAVPGGYEKLWVGTAAMTAAQPDPGYANVLKVLWPSQGNFDVGEGFSEKFVQGCVSGPASAPNCLDLVNFTFWPELPWEQMLVFALGR